VPPIPRAALGLPRSFRAPIVEPDVPVHETPTVSFGDLVRMLAEGIADGQTSLDRASAELVEELAASRVKIIPGITETVDADGNMTFEEAASVEVSLLSLGVTPTFYQFSQATVEVAMDIHVVESETESGEGKRRIGLFAGTASVRAERKLNRDVTVHSKLTATLVPVPMPLRVEPVRTTTTPGP
jgi:hypothetical protein